MPIIRLPGIALEYDSVKVVPLLVLLSSYHYILCIYLLTLKKYVIIKKFHCLSLDVDTK